MRQELLDRFFRYVKIDTQSQEDVEDRYPSTEKQKDLCRLLVDELKALDLQDALMDEYGYVTATLPSNLDQAEADKVPVLGFLAHVDTSPEVSGKDVKPQLIENYSGGDIQLPGDPSQVIKADENPELQKYIGRDIVTSDGTTLLGADNKAGVAEILTAVSYLQAHPEIRHGTMRVGFTPDEETGMGTAHFDVQRFGADFAYTVDGGKAGEVENETFNASLAVFSVTGINVHPGYAKNKLVNAIRVMGDVIQALMDEPAPETTEKREGYLHPYVIEGGIESCSLKLLIRDFDLEGIGQKSVRLKEIQKQVAAKHPKAKVDLKIKEQYRNMRLKLDEDPRVVKYAIDAVRRSGVEPELQIIRGGTDGARLCYQGLLTPNLFTGGINFHSKLEWVAVDAMEKAVETIVNLVQIWVEKLV